jgi:hypothetical protein
MIVAWAVNILQLSVKYRQSLSVWNSIGIDLKIFLKTLFRINTIK